MVRWIISISVGGTSIYGPLAAPIVLMIWLYVLAIAVLIGAALNAAIESVWPRAGDRGGRASTGGRPRRKGKAEPGLRHRRDRAAAQPAAREKSVGRRRGTPASLAATSPRRTPEEDHMAVAVLACPFLPGAR